MNVIDGQAGLVNYSSLIFYSLIINNILNIVIMLILAGITITTALGDNGIINQAKETKRSTIITVLKESTDIAKLNKSLEKEDGMITEEELKEILENYGEIIYDEDGELIEGIIENQEGYEVLLLDIMEGVINQNSYVKLYANGTLAFSHTKNATIEGEESSKDYGNIKEQEYTSWIEEDGSRKSSTPWYNEVTLIKKVSILDKIVPSSMESWFYTCVNLTEFENLEMLDTSKVKSMKWLFDTCSSLETIDLSSFDTRNVEDMNSMFARCSSLTGLNLSSFDRSKVENMGWMFASLEATEILGLEKFDTSKVENMRAMFWRCGNLISLDLSSFNTSKVTNMSNMFEGCTDLTTIYVGTEWIVNETTDIEYMFYGCGTTEVTLKTTTFGI